MIFKIGEEKCKILMQIDSSRFASMQSLLPDVVPKDSSLIAEFAREASSAEHLCFQSDC